LQRLVSKTARGAVLFLETAPDLRTARLRNERRSERDSARHLQCGKSIHPIYHAGRIARLGGYRAAIYRPDLTYDVVQSENSLIILLHTDVFLGNDATGQELLLILPR
jgi:hypothetical protein